MIEIQPYIAYIYENIQKCQVMCWMHEILSNNNLEYLFFLSSSSSTHGAISCGRFKRFNGAGNKIFAFYKISFMTIPDLVYIFIIFIKREILIFYDIRNRFLSNKLRPTYKRSKFRLRVIKSCY